MPIYQTIPHMAGGLPPAILGGYQGKSYFVKPYDGADGNTGKSPNSAKETLFGTYGGHGAATADRNDIVYLVSQSNTAANTTDYLSTTGTWSKDLTHLVGVCSGSRFSHRARVAWLSTASSASDIPLVTWSADGCYCSNVQFFSGIGDANLSFDVLVSGSRNHFHNVHFAGIGHATNDATGAYSLTVSGVENYFEDCVIGLDTIVRTGANYELILSGSKNIFSNCIFLAYSETAGRCMVQSSATNGWNLFENCKFINWTTNLGTGPTNVFDMPAAASSANVYLHGCGAFGGGAAGIGSAWADTDTNIFVSMPIPNTAGGKALAAT